MGEQKVSGKMNSRLLVTTALCCFANGTAFAQTASPATAAPEATEAASADNTVGLEEIVVTAQKRGENLQKVPVAVTAFSSESLRESGVTNITQIANLTPSLSLPQGSGGVVTPFLRGVGSTANAVGNESSVAVYVDGVYYTRLPLGFFSLANVQRVEVLKGPQGTLFGRNSSGGVIQIITSDPSQATKVSGQLGYGAYDTLEGNFYATTGLTDTLAADISIAGRRQGQGYGYNFARQEHTNGYDNFIARSKLLWEPTDATTVLLSGFYGYARGPMQGSTYPGTTQGFVIPPFGRQPTFGFQDQNMDQDTFNRSESWGGTLKIEHELSFAQFTSISALVVEKEHVIVDGDYGARPDYRADLFSTVNQKTQELQLASLAGSELTWILGLYYYDTKSSYHPLRFQGPAFFGPNGGLSFLGVTDALDDGTVNVFDLAASQTARSYAGYAQASYEILPRLKLTGGFRYTIDKLKGRGSQGVSLFNGAATIPFGSAADNSKDERATFKVALDYQITPTSLVYGSFSRGYKSGAYNLLPFTPPPQKAEILDAYEVGMKNEFFDRKVRLNLAVFQYNIKNPQVQLLNNGSITLSNAQKARVRGFEVEGQLAPVRNLLINFGATVLDSKYRQYGSIINGVCVGCAPTGAVQLTSPFGAASPLGSIVAGGNQTPFAAKFTASIGGQYTVETGIGDWTLSGNLSHNSGYFFEPDNFLRQGAFDLVDARLSYKPNEVMTFSVWGRNLLDEQYAQFAGTQQGPAGYPFIAAPPRTYGVTAGFSF